VKKIIVTILQAAVTILLLWWIFRDPEKNAKMWDALQTANWGWLAIGLLCIGVTCLLQTLRWLVLLRVQKINLAFLRTLRVYLVGLFFNLFLLGSTGGDVIKIYYAMREAAGRKSVAFLSVLVDRMMGLLGLVVVAVVIVSIKWQELSTKAPAELSALFIIMGGMLGLVVVGFVVDRFNLQSKIPEKLPMHNSIVEFATAFSIYARNPKALSSTLALSVGGHLCNFLSFYCAARALGAFGGWGGMLDIFAVMPIILTVTSLPISLSGVGVREALFEQLFGSLFGTPEAIAVMISVVGFLMLVFWALVGGVVYLFYRPSGGIHLDEMEKAVSKVEEEVDHPKA